MSIAIASDGRIFVCDHGNDRIQEFAGDGSFVRQWGGAGSEDGRLDRPRGVAIGPDGSIYTTESTPNQRVQRFTPNGVFLDKWGSYGSCDGLFEFPSSIAVDGLGNVYVADNGNNRIQKFTHDGTFVTKWGSWMTGCNPGDWEGGLSPGGVAVAQSGSILVGDGGARAIVEFTPSGDMVRQFGCCGPEYSGPGGIAEDPATGDIYVSNGLRDKVQVFATDGTLLGEFGETGNGDGQFNFPTGIAIGPDGSVYVCDLNNHRIQKFARSSVTATQRSTWGRLKSLYR